MGSWISSSRQYSPPSPHAYTNGRKTLRRRGYKDTSVPSHRRTVKARLRPTLIKIERPRPPTHHEILSGYPNGYTTSQSNINLLLSRATRGAKSRPTSSRPIRNASQLKVRRPNGGPLPNLGPNNDRMYEGNDNSNSGNSESEYQVVTNPGTEPFR